MSGKCTFRFNQVKCSVTVLLLALLTSAPSFGQSLATIGDEDAVGAGIGYSFLDSFSSTTVGVGISSKKTYEFAFGYAFGRGSDALGFSMAMYPFRVQEPVGVGLLAGFSRSISDPDVGAIASLGAQFYLGQKSKDKFMLFDISRVVHWPIHTSIDLDSFTSSSLGVELGLIHPTRVTPSVGFSITRTDPQIGTIYSIGIGVRLPVKSKS